MEERVYLGRISGYGMVYLSKHSWDCDWYWGFGYLGNASCHFHIDSLINHPKEYCENWTDVNHHFESTWITQEQWWIIRDLFIQAYALKKAAETYKHGGNQTQQAEGFRVISEQMAEQINKDLGDLLNTIWNLINEWKRNTDSNH